MDMRTNYLFRLLLYRAPDVPDTWIVHCLDLDAVSQGVSLRDAYNMGIEVIQLLLADDQERGEEPLVRGNKTPWEDWERWRELLRDGARTPLDDVLDRGDDVDTVAVMATFEQGGTDSTSIGWVAFSPGV